MPKIKEDKTFKRISVALNEETYEGIKALAAIADSSITDYVANILAGQVKKNETLVQQVKLARRAYEESLLKVADDDTKKAAE